MTNSIPARLAALRERMRAHGVAAVLVPTADPHSSEYLPDHWRARAWLSGFTGSAGTLLVGREFAGLWTDSRYFSQAEQELAGSGIALCKLRVQNNPEYLDWVRENLRAGEALAVAGDSITVSVQRQIERVLADRGATLRRDLDLVAAIWADRPALPTAPIVEHPIAFACVARREKLDRVREAMRGLGATHHLISSLDDVAWLLNLRGADVECNPVFLAHLLVERDGRTTLFVDRAKLAGGLVAALAADGVEIAQYGAITDALGTLGPQAALLHDPARTASAIAQAIPDAVRRIEAPNPTTAFKAVKTAAELERIRETMRIDGAALARAFHRLERWLAAGRPATELTVDTLLREERSRAPGWVGESFATIAGYEANGALPHYRATPASHSALRTEGLLLVDSGGQYLGGTTDVTRVIALGATRADQRRDSTLVLKGMIALSRACFPQGASGPQLDALARAPLWAECLDYGHGTGHGVGYFLNVHEGPHGIRPPTAGGALVALEPGMISSIEPGLYRPGRHGIRHENLVVVVDAGRGDFGAFLRFETLTLCPFDRRTFDPDALDPAEREWLDRYHETVRREVGPLLDGADREWLERHCAPLR